MHIHILGACGTFMGGIAQLARAMGHTVSGSDQNVYPPMSTQLEAAGIELIEGFEANQLDGHADKIVVGNVMRRGLPVVERMLDEKRQFTSGPEWLKTHLLHQRWVVAVAGTHGKTTTASMVAWILEYAGLKPGFLIGGVPNNFGVSARLGESPFFVIEADEYDTAFFDKRSKFLHYLPNTLILNNLEFDHADIFDDLAAIKRQFHHLMRILPSKGLAVVNQADANLAEVIAEGCWSSVEGFALQTEQGWSVADCAADGSCFEVLWQGEKQGQIQWTQYGLHNVANALAAISAARHCGVPVAVSLAALTEFTGVKRRMELRGELAGVKVYDDFAHHPTAILTTLAGLKHNVNGRVVAVFEPRSNTMKMGVHAGQVISIMRVLF